MANLYSSDNFENMSFDPFQRNSVLLDNLSDPDFNFFNNNKKLIALRFPQICLAPKNLKRLSEIT